VRRATWPKQSEDRQTSESDRRRPLLIRDVRIVKVQTETAAHMLLGGGWLFVQV
jgi:hypothetical protein